MKRYLDLYLKLKGIKAFLGRQRFDSVITVELINFLGSDNRYYSLMVGYNNSEFFVNNNKIETTILGESDSCNDLFYLLDRNLKVFDSKEDWSSHRYSNIDVSALAYKVQKSFERKFSEKIGCVFKDFTVVDIKYDFSYASLLCILYTYKGYPQKSINILLNSIVLLENPIRDIRCAKDFVDFIDWLEVSGFVQIGNQTMDYF